MRKVIYIYVLHTYTIQIKLWKIQIKLWIVTYILLKSKFIDSILILIKFQNLKTHSGKHYVEKSA